MALKLKREVDNTGVFCEYHKISRSKLDGTNIVAFLDSYPSEDVRRMGKTPLDQGR